MRNDVLYGAAQATNQRVPYVQAEQRVLGGPMFGTSRSVETLISDTGGRIAPVRLPWIVTEMHDGKASAVAEHAKSSDSAAAERVQNSTKAPAISGSANVLAAQTDVKVNSAQVAAKKPESKPTTGNIAAALTGSSNAKPTFTSVKPASMPRATKKRGSRGQSVFRADGKGDYYDPLNASM